MCLPGPGGVSAWSGGGVVCLPGPGGGGCLVSAWSGGGLPGLGGGYIPACAEADTLPPPLWTEFLTHACENIILAQLRCGR